MNEQRSERRGDLPSTHWSKFDPILSGGDCGQAALDQVVSAYRPAIYAHLVAQLRGDRETADDYTQDFLLRTGFLKTLMNKAEPTKGRFRSYLLEALNNFLKDKFKEAGSQKRGGHLQRVDLDEWSEAMETSAPDADVFNLEWIQIVVARALARMRKEYEDEQRRDIWEVFEQRLMRPNLYDQEPTNYIELTRQFAFESPIHAARVLTTGKRKCIACLNAVIAEYERNGDRAVQAELEDLKRLLSGLQSPAKKMSSTRAASRRRSRKACRNTSTKARERTPQNEPRQLSQFLDLAMNGDVSRIWQPEELQAVFAHQLAAPMQFDLSGLSTAATAKLKLVSEAEGLLLKSYGDLLQHRCPPVELLRLVKDFAKSHLERPDSLLPGEIAKTLYYVSIAAALLRCAQRITRLGDPKLRAGFDWILGQRWIDAPTKDLVDQARKSLATVQSPSTGFGKAGSLNG